MTKTHYDVEDVPPTDVDTQLELYEQASENVVDKLRQGHQLFNSIEGALRDLFVVAENSGNGDLMNKINMTWEHVQAMAAIMGQQGAALTGARGAIAALKEQRDATVEELDGILHALRQYDSDHPQLADYTDMIREMEMDYYADSADMIIRDDIASLITDFISTLPLGKDYSRKLYMVADDILSIVQGEYNMTEQQKDLIVQLCKTLEHPGGES